MHIENVALNRNEVKALCKQLKRDFPLSERLPYFMFRRALMKVGVMKAVYGIDKGQRCGYIIYAPSNIDGFINILYFAIDPSRRSSGLGGEFLKLFAKEYAPGGVFLEVEDPEKGKDKADADIRKRRVGFYERNGYHLVQNTALRLFGSHLLVMANTDTQVKDWRKLYHKLYDDIIGRKFNGLSFDR